MPAFTESVPATAAAVAVNVTGLPVRPVLVAVSVLTCATEPSVQLPAVAIPAASVVAALPVTDPPPDATANVTATPALGLPCASRTITLGGVDTALPGGAVCPLPAFAAICDAALAVPITTNGVVLEPAEATSCCWPAVVPRVHCAVATPLSSVSDAPGLTDPPPEVTANVTWNLGSGLPLASRTLTLAASTAPTVDDCGSEAVGVIDPADAGSEGNVGKLSHVARRSIVAGTTRVALQARTRHHPLDECPTATLNPTFALAVPPV